MIFMEYYENEVLSRAIYGLRIIVYQTGFRISLQWSMPYIYSFDQPIH